MIKKPPTDTTHLSDIYLLIIGTMKKAAVIRGDGTGLELVDSIMLVVAAVNPGIEFVPSRQGGNGGRNTAETWDALQETGTCFKVPTTTPGETFPRRDSRISHSR